MYKRKLYLFGLLSTFILLIALASAAISAHLTRTNLAQAQLAQSLLSEHQQLSSISYRLFKQLTDELIFGKNANQAKVRNKQQQIENSLNRIKSLELAQREALGLEATLGSVYGLPRYCKSKHAVLTKMVCVRISGFSLKYFHFEPR